MGDLLFAIANLSRKLGIEPEAALRKANDKFTRRFDQVEAAIKARGEEFKQLTLDFEIVSDGRLAVLAVNRGVPFVVSHPESPLSRDLITLARNLAGEGSPANQTDKAAKRGLFARR